MVVRCFNCNMVLEQSGKSDCCNADVWKEVHPDYFEYVCQECLGECEVVTE